MFLFVTSDKIGNGSGAGTVTANELEALQKMGTVQVINPNPTQDPFKVEIEVFEKIKNINLNDVKLAHFYSGTYPEFIKFLKSKNIKVTCTAAAHDRHESQKEFEINNIEYNFPHMTNAELFSKYVNPFLIADVVICPSKHSENVMREIGCKKTAVVPHGCYPAIPKPLPKSFHVGYLGQIGPDKGLLYLIKAWEKLNYKDSILHLAGSQSYYLMDTIRNLKHGMFNIMGYVKDISMFFNKCSIYVQPSVTEGFGIEILESMTFGRPVVASDGAGGSDVLTNTCGTIFQKRNINQLTNAIQKYKNDSELLKQQSIQSLEEAKKYYWPKIQEKYIEVWKSLLHGNS